MARTVEHLQTKSIICPLAYSNSYPSVCGCGVGVGQKAPLNLLSLSLLTCTVFTVNSRRFVSKTAPAFSTQPTIQYRLLNVQRHHMYTGASSVEIVLGMVKSVSVKRYLVYLPKTYTWNCVHSSNTNGCLPFVHCWRHL